MVKMVHVMLCVFYHNLKERRSRAAWAARSVGRLILDFGSGPDLMDREIEPCVGLRALLESAWIVSPPAPRQLMLSLK